MSEFIFEWNSGKAELNWRKHGVTFEEASTVFNDPTGRAEYDLLHSASEDRWLATRSAMASSGSSMRGKRPRRKRDATAPKINVRYVEFTPEEMAYDLPEETDPGRFISVGRGPSAFFRRPSKREIRAHQRRYIELDADLQKFFRDEKAVNDTLRKVVELAMINPPLKRRKSA